MSTGSGIDASGPKCPICHSVIQLTPKKGNIRVHRAPAPSVETCAGSGMRFVPEAPAEEVKIRRWSRIASYIRKRLPSWLNSPFNVAMIALIAAIVGVIIPVVINRLSPPAPTLEVDSVTVTPARFYPARPTMIDFKIRNIGNQLAIIHQFNIQVSQSLRLPMCQGQGSLPSTGTYHATIPASTRTGDVVTVPVSRQLPPDSADDFQVTISPDKDPSAMAFLYRLHLTMSYDRLNTPLDAGYAIISIPIDLNADYYWTEEDSRSFAKAGAFWGSGLPEVTRCLITSSRKLKTFLALPGSRSDALAAFPANAAYCCEASAPVVAIDHCPGRPIQVKPSTLLISCNGSVELRNMKWTRWSFNKATGAGVLQYRYCLPTCAFTSYPVSVVLDTPVHDVPVSNGNHMIWAWSRVLVTYTATPPKGNSKSFILEGLAQNSLYAIRFHSVIRSAL